MECMKEWIPIPGTSRDIIIKAAMEEFCRKGYKDASITELAAKAEMTTGAIYHHFGSKANLYEIIRADLEQRIIDRMEGAASLFGKPEEAIMVALMTGMDFAAKQNICRLMGEDPPYKKNDRIEEFLAGLHGDAGLPIEIVLLPAWRSILLKIAEGRLEADGGKNLIKWMLA